MSLIASPKELNIEVGILAGMEKEDVTEEDYIQAIIDSLMLVFVLVI